MSGHGSRKGRRLSGEEQALWDTVASSVKPLRKRALKRQPAGGDDAPAPRMPHKTSAKPVVVPSPPRSAAPPPLATLDRRTKQKIARGRHDIDGRIDLHGFTQSEAHAALLRFLRTMQAKGGKVVLVITGKGASAGTRHTGEGRGILRRQVPLWLALPEFRDYVVGFDAAAIGHGGEGALYVRLRKRRA